MATFKEFTAATPRPLPVILLADVSASMGVDGKIDALNTALVNMIGSFAAEQEARAEVHVAVITFGLSATLHVPLQPVRGVDWTPLTAEGMTPMGAAFRLAADLIQDADLIPSRAYRPTLVLVSDGLPTDDVEDGLEALSNGRPAKVQRFALAIGADADEAMLQRFLADPELRVYHAEDAHRIKDFFRFVTMSVTTRSRSADPNAIPVLDDPFEDLEY